MRKRKKPTPKYRTLQEQRAWRAFIRYNKTVNALLRSLDYEISRYVKGQKF